MVEAAEMTFTADLVFFASDRPTFDDECPAFVPWPVAA